MLLPLLLLLLMLMLMLMLMLRLMQMPRWGFMAARCTPTPPVQLGEFVSQPVLPHIPRYPGPHAPTEAAGKTAWEVAVSALALPHRDLHTAPRIVTTAVRTHRRSCTFGMSWRVVVVLPFP